MSRFNKKKGSANMEIWLRTTATVLRKARMEGSFIQSAKLRSIIVEIASKDYAKPVFDAGEAEGLWECLNKEGAYIPRVVKIKSMDHILGPKAEPLSPSPSPSPPKPVEKAPLS